MAHITPDEAEALLLFRFGLESVDLLWAHVDMAEAALVGRGPFHGERYAEGQTSEFPRTPALEGDVEGEIPQPVLDYLALVAAAIAGADEMVAVSSESLSEVASESYARPKITKLEAYLSAAELSLRKYQRVMGVLR